LPKIQNFKGIERSLNVNGFSSYLVSHVFYGWATLRGYAFQNSKKYFLTHPNGHLFSISSCKQFCVP